MKIIRCQDVTEEANNYINGDLPLGKRFALFIHLVLCRCCRNYLQQLYQTIEMLTIVQPKEKEQQIDLTALAESLRDIHCHHSESHQ